jgi:hypothetical protein
VDQEGEFCQHAHRANPTKPIRGVRCTPKRSHVFLQMSPSRIEPVPLCKGCLPCGLEHEKNRALPARGTVGQTSAVEDVDAVLSAQPFSSRFAVTVQPARTPRERFATEMLLNSVAGAASGRAGRHALQFNTWWYWIARAGTAGTKLGDCCSIRLGYGTIFLNRSTSNVEMVASAERLRCLQEARCLRLRAWPARRPTVGCFRSAEDRQLR